ncbi:polyhydroxybutyrate depolymerase [Actinomadura craniellae]|uniref:Polyhydroxybutyrate depolymerase n=1 Tax=Actinomadura craniellae TaxID=2231787 RepID=A0A365GWX4_9ACTN|nr:PHB depolymerase family esterase [Actinomadura craniellae]RAY11282.1 polyhydroxybutyrate depolymerase [Actinomadura craniellae]
MGGPAQHRNPPTRARPLRSRFLARLLLAGALACAACTPGGDAERTSPGQDPWRQGTGTSSHTITVDGRERAFLLYRPANLPAPAPLVVMLHGALGSARQAERSYGWNAQADQGRFLVAYPDGTNRTWAVGDGCCGGAGRSGVDDVAFVTRMVAEIGRRIPVDRSRVYASGMSNGGMLAYRLACTTDVFAAYGPVAATLLGPCPDPAPTSLIHVHGTADRRVRYDGAPSEGLVKVDGQAVEPLTARWSKTGRCARPQVTRRGDVTTTAASCPDGHAVHLIAVRGAGHQWPGSQPNTPAQERLRADPPSRALDATAAIWAFFATHPKPR